MGAKELSELARELEDAGDRGDWEVITDMTPKLLDMCHRFREKLAPIDALSETEQPAKADKPAISSEDLENAYSAIAEFAPQMDYDAVEMVLGELNEYALPPEDEKKVKY